MSVLKFGKFKGQQLENTPVWYQNWLLKQDWFKKPTEPKNLSGEFGVFYVATKEAKLFAGLKDELLEKFKIFEDAKEYCESCNMGGYLDEMHSGYVVRPI